MIDGTVWPARDTKQDLLPRSGRIALGQQASGEQDARVGLHRRFRDGSLEQRDRGLAQARPHVLVREVAVQHAIVRVQVQRDPRLPLPVATVADLGKKLRRYIRAYSKSAKPFCWTYTDPTRRIRPNKIAGTAY